MNATSLQEANPVTLASSGDAFQAVAAAGYQPAFGFASGLSGRWFHDGRATSISVAPDGRNFRADDTRTRKSSIESEYNYMKMKSFILRLVLVSVALGVVGCEGYYSASPGYYGGPGPYYGAGPYYGGYPGSVTVEIGDRPYYTRGPGYYVGRSYYVWRPGHWAWRYGRRVWIHGHYVVR